MPEEPVRLLAWDSGFFGFPVGMLDPRLVSPDALAADVESARRRGIRCIYCLLDSGRLAMAPALEDAGFRLVDLRIELSRELPRNLSSAPSGVLVPPVRELAAADLESLRTIASGIFLTTRFYADPHFDRARVSEMYSLWFEKDASGGAEKVFVATGENGPAGFVTCRLQDGDHTRGVVSLLGVGRGSRGRGLGRGLVDSALEWFESVGARRAEVVTQAGNASAVSLYERCGFRVERAGAWFHAWPGDPS